jgi:hypothetical protein
MIEDDDFPTMIDVACSVIAMVEIVGWIVFLLCVAGMAVLAMRGES